MKYRDNVGDEPLFFNLCITITSTTNSVQHSTAQRACLQRTPRPGVRDGRNTHESSFDPRWRKTKRELDEKKETNVKKWKAAYDEKAKPLREFADGDPVWIQDNATKRWTIKGVVVEAVENHDYMVEQSSGRVIRRNRVYLRKRAFWPGAGPPPPATGAPAPIAPAAPPPAAITRNASVAQDVCPIPIAPATRQAQAPPLAVS